MKKGSFWKNYGFLILMLTGIVAGCVVGAIWPAVKDASGEVIVKGATVLEPLGTVFLNLMFCIAVPTVFCSISSSIANMQSAKRAGKIMGVTVATFLITAAIAAVKGKTVKAKAKKATKSSLKVVTSKSGAKSTFKKTSGNKKVTVSKSGKIVVKKGLKAGKKYTVKVKATVGASTKTVKVVVKVAK